MARTSQTIEAKLLGLLALLLALCLNPVVSGKLLTADGNLESGGVQLTLWLLTGLLVLAGLLLFRGLFQLTGQIAKIFLLLGSTLLTFYLTVLADRLVGKLLLPPTQSLIFPANTTVKYTTPEFVFTARINHLGFRDREYSLQKGQKFRIIVIGDSFTFGWGVELQDTWVKRLERHLQQLNPAVEVLNLGRSGGSPETYAAIAAKVIPVLQPDLVLVALLQGNDLQQLLPEQDQPAAPAPRLPLKKAAQIAVANAYPNFLRLLTTTTLQTEINTVWEQQAATILRHFTAAQQARYRQLDPQVRHYFRQGLLNPDLVYDFLKDPAQFLHLENTAGMPVQRAVGKLKASLKQIQAVAAQNKAQVLALSVPNKYYLCPQTMREHTRLGAAIDTRLIERNTPDSLVAAITEQLRLPFYSATPTLRRSCPDQRLYYPLDSHFTPLGNKLFAAAIFAQLKKPILALTGTNKINHK